MKNIRRVACVAVLVVTAATFGCSAKRSDFVSFTATPRFSESEGKTYFVAPHDGQEYRVFWSCWGRPKPPEYPSNFKSLTLHDDQPYRFTFAFNDNTSGLG